MAGNAIDGRAELVGDLERPPVGRRQELGLAAVAAVPHRPDGVDDPAGGEAEARRGPGVAGGAAPERGAGIGEPGTGRGEDGAADAAAAGQAGVGGVHDGVGGLAGDVAPDGLERGPAPARLGSVLRRGISHRPTFHVWPNRRAIRHANPAKAPDEPREQVISGTAGESGPGGDSPAIRRVEIGRNRSKAANDSNFRLAYSAGATRVTPM